MGENLETANVIARRGAGQEDGSASQDFERAMQVRGEGTGRRRKVRGICGRKASMGAPEISCAQVLRVRLQTHAIRNAEEIAC